jgi:hypothetical protein
MTRFSAYGRYERAIRAADAGTIRQRWEYGRRLLCDPAATTPDGNLRHGVIADLITEAHKAGRKLSDREIRYRMEAGRAYPYESQIRHLGADFDSWRALRDAGFPALCDPEPGEKPFDPRGLAEKARSVDRQLALGQPDPDQLPLFEFFPDDRYDALSTLADLRKYAEESADRTARHARKDTERFEYLRRLLSAVNGNEEATWEEAQAALDTAEGGTA